MTLLEELKAEFEQGVYSKREYAILKAWMFQAVREEREACAKLLESFAPKVERPPKGIKDNNGNEIVDFRDMMAKLIRNR